MELEEEDGEEKENKRHHGHEKDNKQQSSEKIEGGEEELSGNEPVDYKRNPFSKMEEMDSKTPKVVSVLIYKTHKKLNIFKFEKLRLINYSNYKDITKML